MEKIERHHHHAHGYRRVEGAPEPPPLKLPPFTLKQIRDAIPSHCFERSLVLSSGYLFLNVFCWVGLLYGATFIKYFPLTVQFFVWPMYWVAQVVCMAGIWVLAHEAGHGGFSDYPRINDVVGFILHSSLLVPYQNWKISHHKHHQNGGSCDNDEVFVPPTRSTISSSHTVQFLEDSPIYQMIVTLLIFFSWMPGYLVYNFSGPLKNRHPIINDEGDPGNCTGKKSVSHFSPQNPIFLDKQRGEILLGNCGFFLSLGGLIYLSILHGFGQLYLIYVIPYWGLSFMLIFITFLHHTDTFVPHFRGPEWTWMRGALCTVDRSMGPWIDGAVHHISDTHVIHHLFPSMPFYHAVEATAAMSKILGPYHLKDETPVWIAFWRLMSHCRFVEDDGNIVFYKKYLKDL